MGLSILIGVGAGTAAAGTSGAVALGTSVAIAGSTAAASGALAAGIAAGTITSLSLSSIASVVSAAASLIGSIASSGGSPALANSGIRGKVGREPDGEHQILYGTRRVSGQVYFSGVVGPSGNPKKNKYLWIGIVFGGHEFTSFGQAYLNDTEMDADRYTKNNSVQYHEYYLGTETQTADAALLADFPELDSNFRLLGLAHGLFKFKYQIDPPIWVNGIPNISVIAQGRKVADPRNSWVASYSTNSALCLADYLMSDFGLRVPQAKIDEASLIAAANICDESVPLKGGGTQARYTTNGMFNRGDKPIDVVEQLKAAMVGEVVYSKGIYYIHAGAYQAPALHLDESYLTGPVTIETRTSGADSWNAVRGRYTTDQPPDDDAGSMPTFLNTDFVPQISAQYIVDDNSVIPLWRDLGLPYTTDPIRAQRIAHIWLERGRMQREITFPANVMGIAAEAWQTCTLSIAALGIVDEIYRISAVKLTPEFTTELTLIQEAASVYDWDAATMEGGQTPGDAIPVGSTDLQVPDMPLATFSGARTVETDVLTLEGFLDFEIAPPDFDDGVLSYSVSWGAQSTSVLQRYDYDATPPVALTTDVSLGPLAAGFFDVVISAINEAGSSTPATFANLELSFTRDPSEIDTGDLAPHAVSLFESYENQAATTGEVVATLDITTAGGDVILTGRCVSVSEEDVTVELRRGTTPIDTLTFTHSGAVDINGDPVEETGVLSLTDIDQPGSGTMTYSLVRTTGEIPIRSRKLEAVELKR